MTFQNYVNIEGRLTSKPEIATTSSGKKIARFSICYNEPKKLKEPDNEGKIWTTVPNFFNITAWEKNADTVSVYDKGDAISVIGKLKFNEWTDTDSQKKRQSVYILAESVKKFDLPKANNNNADFNTENINENNNPFEDTQIPFSEGLF